MFHSTLCGSGGIRTHSLTGKSRLLCAVELRIHVLSPSRIRTAPPALQAGVLPLHQRRLAALRELLAEPRAGLEPATPGLFSRCSFTELSGHVVHLRIRDSESRFHTHVWAWVTRWWGRQELNLRPPAQKCRRSTLSYCPVRNGTSPTRFSAPDFPIVHALRERHHLAMVLGESDGIRTRILVSGGLPHVWVTDYCGGSGGIRTHDRSVKSRLLLIPLSYRSVMRQ